MNADASTLRARRIYAALLRMYPASFREEYGGEMRAAFADRWSDVRQGGGLLSAAGLWMAVSVDTLVTAAREHLDLLRQDARLAWRTLFLRRNLSFTLASVLTLAVGIGAVAAIFSIVYAVLLAPLPYREPQRVVHLTNTNGTLELRSFETSVPDFLSWREQARSFSGLAAFWSANANLTGDGEPQRVRGLAVTASFWDVLRLPLVEGRPFAASEAAAGGAPVVILSDGLWRRRYGGDPSIVGRTIRVNGAPRTVIGIARQDVGFASDVDVWLPLATDARLFDRSNRELTVIGRLASGVTLAQAQDEMRRIGARLAAEFPDADRNWSVRVESARDWIVGAGVRTRLWLLLAAVGVLLLVACTNVASLQVARAATRRREIGVRLALGASRARLVRQTITESFVLTGIGGLCGIAVAWACVRAAAASLPASMPRLAALSLNGPAVLIALALVVVTATLFGLLPATTAARTDVAVVLQAGGRAEVGAHRTRWRRALVATQMALATLLLVGAGMLIENFVSLQRTALGFQPGPLLTANVLLPQQASRRDLDRNARKLDELLENVQALPGVAAAGLTSAVPFGDQNTSMSVATEPHLPGAADRGVEAAWRVVSADYFRALGVPLRRGRFFAAHGEPSHSILLSEGLVRRLWPNGTDPVGRSVYLANGQTFTVVGLVGDVRQIGVADDYTPTMYLPMSWYFTPTMTLVVRADGDSAMLAGAVRRAALQVLPEYPLFDVQTMSAVVAADIAQPRLQAVVLIAFAAIGLFLAVVGIAGVVAYFVAGRAPELALRLALGASPGRVEREVLGQGIVLCATGVAVGLVLTVIAGAALRGLLDGLRADGWFVSVTAAAALLAAGFIASWLPARRALRIDPSLALRSE